MGVPLTLIGEAVFARVLSSLKEERVRAAGQLGSRPEATPAGSEADNIKAIHDALYAAKIISYAQGFMLMREAAREQGWALDYGAIALMWRGGCIIRSTFLGNIRDAYENNPQLENLAQDRFFTDALKAAEANWRKAVILAIENGVPIPAIASALSYYDGYRSARLPANLLQAQP